LRDERPFTFIHVSSLNEQKNPQAIIEAFVSFHKTYPRSQLIIAGEIQGELFQYILQEKLSANSIQFTGMVPYSTIAALMQKSEVFILFSRYENMPCVVLEALCCGLPVISSDTGGLPEVINSDNGILVHEYTTAALTHAMVTMYVSYLQYNKQNIAAEARSKFSYDVIGEELKNIYTELLENGSKE
jgi:glycosyltransferase involved in cell wall biosynthesis